MLDNKKVSVDNEIAIVIAAGVGTRMRPLTNTTPKPLIKVFGKSMIETVIDALEKRGVDKIYIVVGYLWEQFNYLEKKYTNLNLIYNKDYQTVNNISSIHVVTDKMRESNCFICEADLYLKNINLLSINHSKSCYYGKMIKGHSDDWIFETDDRGRIIHIGKVGDDCYNMCGISYFLKNDATIIADAVDIIYGQDGYEELFWDEVVDSIIDRIYLEVHPVEVDDIVEIDTVEELRQID